MARAVAGSALLLVLVPAILFAQEDELRAQIRADIEQDPRSAEMSETEKDQLVEALAQEAEETGVADEYIESHSTFDPSKLFAPPEEPSMVARIIFSPVSLAVLLLLLALGAVIYYIFHRGKAQVMSDVE